MGGAELRRGVTYRVTRRWDALQLLSFCRVLGEGNTLQLRSRTRDQMEPILSDAELLELATERIERIESVGHANALALRAPMAEHLCSDSTGLARTCLRCAATLNQVPSTALSMSLQRG